MQKFEKINKTTLSQESQKQTNTYLSLPYFPIITNKLENLFKKYSIKVAYNGSGKLRDWMETTKTKQKIEEKSGVYKLICNNCEKFYIGKTKRQLRDRLKEHRANIKNKQPHLSAMAKHCLDEGHTIAEINLLDEVKKPWMLTHYENMHIYKNMTGEMVNLDLKEITRSPLSVATREHLSRVCNI